MAQGECGTLEGYGGWRGGWGGRAEEVAGARGGPLFQRGRRSQGLPPSLSHHRQPGIDSLDSEAGLAAWRRQQRQLEYSWRASS